MVYPPSRRLLRFDLVRSLLDGCVQVVLGRRKVVRTAAIDATGFEAGQVSPYFVKRYSRAPGLWQTTTYTRFPKLGLIGDRRTHLSLAAFPSRGPSPNVHQLEPMLGQLVRGLRIDQLLGDAGYNGEPNHQLLHEYHGIRSLIPPKIGRPTRRPVRGRYRRLMQRLFRLPERTRYGQRWQIETVFSMIKRNLCHAIREHTCWNQGRGMLLQVLTHNLMILLSAGEVFYGATHEPFSEIGQRDAVGSSLARHDGLDFSEQYLAGTADLSSQDSCPCSSIVKMCSNISTWVGQVNRFFARRA